MSVPKLPPSAGSQESVYPQEGKLVLQEGMGHRLVAGKTCGFLVEANLRIVYFAGEPTGAVN